MELVIRDISRTYPSGIRALDGVTLSVPAGMFGLLGPNGAGKTTLMTILATLQDPDVGTVTLGDVDLVRDKQAARARIGYLPQEFGVYPHTDAERMLDYLASLKGFSDRRERRREVAALLELTNLTACRKQDLDTYSGGMRQRFGIAQALLGKPDLVIVDEPTAGLDPQERVRFHNLLAEIGEDRVVILSTHIVEDVTTLCRRVAVLAGGRVVRQGEPAELKDGLNGQVWEKPMSRADVADCRRRFELITTRLTAGQVVARVRSQAPPAEGFMPVPPTLEDVYFMSVPQPAA
jgi:ABC-2 type transport system ATP-binding protein